MTGLYPVTGEPFKTFTISGDTATGKLAVTEQTAGRMPYTTRYWRGADGAWNMAQGEGEDAVYTLKEKQVISPDTWKLVTTIQRGEHGTPISRVCETYAVTRNGNLCTSRIEGYGTAYARETTYEYNSMGKVSKETAPDGSVKTWSYDRFGREIVSTVPWSGGGDKATYTTYRDDTQADPDILAQRATLTATALDLWQTAYTYTEADHVRRVEKRTTALGAEGERLEVKETWLGTAPNVHARGRLKMTQGIDGVQTHYAYEPTDQYGALYRVTAETRITGEPVPGHSTRKVTYVSEQGNNMRYEQYALLTDGTWAMTDASTYEYDAENRWTKRTRANGRVYERAMMCCGPLWEKDEDGVMTTYSYNTARQLVEEIRSEVTDGTTVVTPETITSYTRDALGKITALRKDTGPMTVTESRAYDLLGRLTSETDVLGRETTHAYSEDGLTETVTTPTGATLITQKHPDGTVLRRYGTGQRDVQYTTEATEEGVVRSMTLPQETGEPVLKEQSVTNGWNQVVRISQANANGGLIHKRHTFDEKNRLLRQEVEGMAPGLYEYDDFGNLVKTTLKLAEAPTPANSLITEYAYSRENARTASTASSPQPTTTAREIPLRNVRRRSSPPYLLLLHKKALPRIPGATTLCNGRNTRRLPNGRPKRKRRLHPSSPKRSSWTVMPCPGKTMQVSSRLPRAPTRQRAGLKPIRTPGAMPPPYIMTSPTGKRPSPMRPGIRPRQPMTRPPRNPPVSPTR